VVQVTAKNAVTYTLTNAPSGMSISAGGVVSWANPVTGVYAVTVKATDVKTGLSGSAVCNVTIKPAQAPVVTAQTISGAAGKALSFNVTTNSSDPLTYALTGAPANMVVSSTGVVSWSNPVAGTYAVTVNATDKNTGLVGKGVMSIIIAAPGPAISTAALAGSASKAFAGSIGFSDATSTSLKITVSGVPAGVTMGISGSTISVSWPTPAVGSYPIKVSVVDGNGLSSTATVTLSITK
jgi:hypothetical protein